MRKTAALKKTATTTPAAIPLPELAKGEHLAGLIMAKGAPSHWVILLPRDKRDITWAEAKEFAKECGGELPTRAEQALLFANLKGEFEPRFYWSSEQRAEYPVSAWGASFDDGYQGYTHKGDEYRARAVRRVPI